MFPSEWPLLTCHRCWMVIQTFYLFNSFSLLWNRRGAPRDHQFYFWQRLSFLNTEAPFCQIISLSLNGAAFLPEWAFNIQVGSDSRQKRNTLPFCLHSIWWEAASNTLKIKPWYPSFPDFTSWLHTLTIKTISDKNALKHFFSFSLSLFYKNLYLFCSSDLNKNICSEFSNYSIFITKSRIKKDD